MVDDENPTLGLDEVVKRFADSERALSDIESKIENLSRLQAQTRASAEALDKSASSIDSYAEETQELTSELAETTRAARQLLERARAMLDGSQLQRIEDVVSENRAKSDEVLSTQGSEFERLREALDGVDSSVSEMGSRLAAELDVSEEIAGVRGAVGSVHQALGELESGLAGEIQSQASSIDSKLAAHAKSTRWLLVGAIILEAVILGVIILGGV